MRRAAALLVLAGVALSGCNIAVMTLVGIGVQAAFHIADDGTLIYLQKEQERHATPAPQPAPRPIVVEPLAPPTS